jgi:hypothetical protein
VNNKFSAENKLNAPTVSAKTAFGYQQTAVKQACIILFFSELVHVVSFLDSQK